MIGEGHKTTVGIPQQAIPASWYRALTLPERIALWRADNEKRVSLDQRNTDLAASKLRWWKELPAFQQEGQFAQRLAIDGLVEEDLLYLLAEPIEAVRQRFAGDLTWLDKLQQAFSMDDKDMPCPLPPMRQEEGIDLLARAIRPLLRSAWKRVYVEMQILLQRQQNPPFDPLVVMTQLFQCLPGQLFLKVSKVLALELNVMRLEGRLRGETPEERFAFFADWCSQPQVMLSILGRYPVLARQLMTHLDQWRETSLEFLQRLCADWREICTLFSPDADPGFLIEVLSGTGDVHRGGRSVFLLCFHSGLRLVYKPRSLSIDTHFQILLQWLNVRSKLPPFRLSRLLDKGTYGWCEFIEAHDCSEPEQVERFYIRQGAYLALLYMLSATDVHAENLVAAGEQPVLVDLEALFCPRIRWQEDRPSVRTEFDDALQSSVLSVGLLPYRFWSSERAPGMDMSGMSELQGQVVPVAVPRWAQVGTDQMRIVRDFATMGGRQNRPRLRGQPVDLCSYQHCIVFGFVSMYRLLVECREELLQTMLPRFARDEIRVILRPTMAYSLVLQESFHPDVLRDALDLYRYMDRLWTITRQQPYMTSVIAAEQADLLSGDIPFFLTRVSSYDLYTSRGEQVRDFCSHSGMDMAVRRLQKLDDTDLMRQVWIIQASLASITEQELHFQPPTLQLRTPAAPATPERLQTAARSIGRRLDTLSFHQGDTLSWLTLTPGRHREWYIGAVGCDLYNGLAGLALFLAYLGKCDGHEESTTLARTIVSSLCQQLESSPSVPLLMQDVGGFAGWGSLLYLFSHLIVLWNEPWLVSGVERVLEQIEPLIEHDQQLDVVHGSAGCLLALLSLYQVLPTARVLANAIRCGDHLLQTLHLTSPTASVAALLQRGLLTGYAHGAAGMALSLMKLSVACQQERFRIAANALLSFERQLFSSTHNNWPDLRPESTARGAHETDEGTSSRFVVAWCHGAAGLGLSRMELLHYDDSVVMRQEVEIALKTTLKEGFGFNHSLCHGDLGNLELLLTATQRLGMTEYLEPLAQLTAMLLECGERTGWVSGLPLGVETPGMMLGLAGIGYELLRLAQPQSVPNLLLLSPPTRMVAE
ncbi:type 2 lanthipeptide synthetase LanM family protein [Dictyobacter aurantiacus]|uniref:Lanthionine synthetase n=1 Tax=Dictyobacter aurantiacus TaxID=1936993 RepID=A0A401ZPG1_9CHLR|nr:type 2 lanthipeptide synthetase LanM family protein [Dictyobacter aurantiacus]GCE08700.1 lanthionine synthetase [Dictyobacter aurantiacus]